MPLVSDAPAAVAALDDVDPAGGVAAVGVVVAGEQVAEFVEGKVLRVAQAGVEQLEVGPVRLAAEHRAAVGVADVSAVGRGDVEAAVANAEVDAPVGPEAQAVQVVAGDLVVDAEAGVQGPAEVGLAVAVGVAQQPEIGNVGEVDVAAKCEHSGGGAVFELVEAGGEDRVVVGPAVAVAVFDQAHAVGFDLHRLHGRSPAVAANRRTGP